MATGLLSSLTDEGRLTYNRAVRLSRPGGVKLVAYLRNLEQPVVILPCLPGKGKAFSNPGVARVEKMCYDFARAGQPGADFEP